MNSDTKRQNITGTLTDDIDRLSSLPDCVLLHLLSFLPTKWAARTSILSKRWRDLFLDVTKIELDDSPSFKTPAGNPPSPPPIVAEFTRFVTRRLMLRSSAVNEFRLKCPAFSKGSQIDVWLENLLSRGIKVLEISQLFRGSGIYLVRLPNGFFQSKTLVVLKFEGGTLSFDSCNQVHFPNLKVLSLHHMNIQVKSKTLRICDQGYPVLEDFSLRILQPNYKIAIEISSKTLKRLTLRDLNPIHFTRIDVDTPHLQDLSCMYVGTLLSLRRCETLESAKFGLNSASYEGQNFIETLKAINNVKVLGVMLWSTEIPKEVVDCLNKTRPQFPHLFSLKFDHSPSRCSKAFLFFLLRGTPNLKKLFSSMDACGEFTVHSEKLPPCFGRCLGEIELKGFRGIDAQVALVEQLLNQGAVLRSIVLSSEDFGTVVKNVSGQSLYNNVSITTMNRLVKMGKLYPKCEIQFT